jgi:perosamine synthetase
MFEKIVGFMKSLYPAENPVPLYAPRFSGNEKKYLETVADTCDPEAIKREETL